MASDPKSTPAAGDAVDMFLQVKSSGSLVKGEAQDDKHQDEIEVVGWSWGMSLQNAPGGQAPISKRTIRELNVVKKIDAASVPLMMALSNNAMIDAVLTVRKAGKTQHEYLKISIKKGRITALEVRAGTPGSDAAVEERVSFAFQKISVEYVPQGVDGQPRGGMIFEDQTA